jgi:Cof subfamily protein (haloacid dehalogenase superfamily)
MSARSKSENLAANGAIESDEVQSLIRAIAQRDRAKRRRAKYQIKLVAIDLDGTLLDQSKQVSEQTAGALRCVSDSGAKIVIASARPPRSVRHIYRQLGLDTWQINYNGALIWDEPGSSVIFHKPMPGDLVRAMISLARGVHDGVLVSCEILDRWCTDRDDNSHTTETGRLFKPDLIAPVEQFCSEPVTKLMFLGAPQVISDLEPLLLEEFANQVRIVRTDDDLIQVMDHDVGKSAALQMVADHYGVSMENVMAIGDAPNDVGMLQMARVAIAMDNAHLMVKDLAHWVAPSNNDHGVHAALRRYGLCD